MLGHAVKKILLRSLLYPHRLLPAALKRHGSGAAFGNGCTFAALLDRARRLAGHWASRGVRPADPVLIDLPNDPAFVEARVAGILGGLVAVPVPPGTPDDRLGWMAEFCGARTYLGTRPGVLPGLDALSLEPVAGDRGAYEAALAGAAPLSATPGIRGDSLITINFTSGTTGDPKGVMGTAAGWGWSLYYSLAENKVPLEPGEVILHALPLSTAGSGLILPAVLSGAKSLFLPAWDAEVAAKMVEKERVTRLFLTPTLLAEFVDAVRRGRRDTRSLRAVVYGTEAIPVARVRRAVGVLGPVLQQGYGMAEALPPVSLLHQAEHAAALRDGDEEVLASTGRPTGAVDLRIFGPGGEVLEAGCAGSIRLRGRTVSPGYWRRPDLTEASRSGGFYVTGDVGFLDGRGYLHVLGREGALPSASARRWVEWAEARPEVCLAWVQEGTGGPTLHVVPAGGAEAEAVVREAVQGAAGELAAFALHAQPPRTPSYKLRLV
ncbi:MAG: long-chain fatty acid--CoA ligase [Thermodesulfobacteriota bacterium]